MADIVPMPLLAGTSAPPGGQFLSLFNAFVHPAAQQRVAAVLQSTFLSEGKLVKEFKARLAA